MSVQSSVLPAVMAEVERAFAATIERLKQLVRIPSCSFPGFDPAHVAASAQDTADWLRTAGYPDVRVVALPGATHPYVLARDHRAGPDRPTLLLYAHHDVQPPLREYLWQSPPFTPTERDGRLYARGAADDKAGIAVHAASAAAWNAVAGQPPVNLTVLIEGEEEINSPHFAAFLDAHLPELRADALVIADLANVATGLPSLTTSLRGLVAVEVELRALKSPLHSGMWGGAVPDPTLALCRLLASLADAHGELIVAGVMDDVRAPSAAELASFARMPYDAADFTRAAGAHAPLDPDPVRLHTRLWKRPALSINAIQAGSRGQTGNVIMDAAWARVGIRIVPEQRADAVLSALTAHLRAHAPDTMSLTITPIATGEAWSTTPEHPFFAVAERALAAGYGAVPVYIGCGASIPFVGTMSARLGGIPALLVGVEDPACAAHAENESVHLGDLLSAIRAQAALFGLMAESP